MNISKRKVGINKLGIQKTYFKTYPPASQDVPKIIPNNIVTGGSTEEGGLDFHTLKKLE